MSASAAWDLALANRAGNGAEFGAGASAAAAAASSSTGVAALLDPTSSLSGLLSPACPAAEQQQEQGGPDPAHAVMVLQGLCSLRSKSVLTDVTLLADGQRFDVHKVILVSCSDYFRSMFTSGMKECSQSEIELKGVTAKGLEKVLDIIYTSSTSIEGDDVFDILAAATHLQVMPVLEFCERNFLRNMTAANFTDFIVTARLYNMAGVLAQIDKFIAANLLSIADGPALSQLGLDQMLACLRSPHCRLREIDVFRAVQLWLDARDQQQQCMEQLLTEIRYNLIAPSDLVSKVQLAPAVMANARLHSLLLQALNYHVVPHCQPLCTPPDMWLRCYREQLVCVGGRDLQPTTPGLVEDCSALLLPKPSQGATAAVAAAESPLMSAGRSSSTIRRHTLASLPTPVSHAQCVVLNNFLYVLGGCVTQCAHAESAVNAVSRFDLRFNAWYQCAPMLQRRAYFAAGIVMVNRRPRIMVVAGRRKEGALQHCELYDPEANCWTAGPSLGQAFYSHAGAVYKDTMYISGGYANENFYPDVHKLRPAAQFWEECAPMLAARGWHCMVEAAGRLYVCGGCSLNAANNALPVLQCEQYNAEADQWTIVSPMPVSHKEACAVAVDRHVYVLGGFNVHTKTGQRLVCRLDLDSHQWETVGSFSHSTTGVCACLLKVPPYLLPYED
ncbi:hypothetical protein BOX15_Mlig034024g1 [Macrostomum lignano]|uniref:BTB domain-containing protein n=1 Tax=Macrostomum lignano TaxID=282301 RepID=A0A267G8P9_9PLAT|nr:hypothetical protein BOX15_Mlig034024g1 [Macrostomum lignano]